MFKRIYFLCKRTFIRIAPLLIEVIIKSPTVVLLASAVAMLRSTAGSRMSNIEDQ